MIILNLTPLKKDLQFNSNIKHWLTIFFLAFIWGSSFILIKRSLITFSGVEVGALRMLIASIVLMPFAFRKIKKIDKKHWKFLAIVGLVGNGIPAFLFALAQTRLTSSLAGMINSLVPIFTLILGYVVFGYRFDKYKIGGVLLGLAGASSLIYTSEAEGGNDLFYALLVVFATVCYATSVNVIKKYLGELNSILITAASLLLIGPLCGIYFFLTAPVAELFTLEKTNLISIGALVILSVFGTALAIVVFNMLIKRVSALFATTVTYLIPVVAIFWGLWDGETLGILHIIGMSCIFTGIYLINKQVKS